MSSPSSSIIDMYLFRPEGFKGSIWPSTAAVNGGAKLFEDDKDRLYLLGRLEEAGERHGVRMYLFCLMQNHFHLVLETPRGNLGRYMQGVLTGCELQLFR